MKREIPSYIYKALLIILLSISSFNIIYNIILLKNIENLLRFIGTIILVIIFVILIIYILKRRLTFTKTICLCTYFLILLIGSTSLHKIYLKIDSMSVSYNIEQKNLIKLKSNNKNSNIIYGVTNKDLESFEELQKQNNLNGEVITVNNYNNLIDELYDGKIDYIYLPSNYSQMFNNIEKYSNLSNDTEVIYTKYDKEQIESKNINFSKESFSILLMGVDSSENNMINSSFNGDALILLTFNPNTFNTTILSIPRDTYTNITCFNDERKNKITHAAWYGESCMKESIEKLFDINIDYFVKINFKGFVYLIELLGGIEVDVPMYFCEQDSNRSFENLICVDKGYQKLNGEEALALARHRKTINDFIRGDNQKILVNAILEKIKKIDNINTIYQILDTISSNIITNIKTEDILSMYNLIKKMKNIDISSKIINLKIEGIDDYIYDYSYKNNEGMNLLLYEFIPYIDSINYISRVMKQNLNNEEIDRNYENNYNTNVFLLPDFTKMSEQETSKYCNEHNIKLNINYVDSDNQNNYIGQIINQNKKASTDLEYIDNEITIDVIKEVIKIEKINCSKIENKNDKECIIPDFTNKKYEEFKNWLKNNNYSFIVDEEKVSNKEKKGLIIDQNYKNISIYDILGKRIKITYAIQ